MINFYSANVGYINTFLKARVISLNVALEVIIPRLFFFFCLYQLTDFKIFHFDVENTVFLKNNNFLNYFIL